MICSLPLEEKPENKELNSISESFKSLVATVHLLPLRSTQNHILSKFMASSLLFFFQFFVPSTDKFGQFLLLMEDEQWGMWGSMVAYLQESPQILTS